MRPLTNTYASIIGEHAARMVELDSGSKPAITRAPMTSNTMQSQDIAALASFLHYESISIS